MTISTKKSYNVASVNHSSDHEQSPYQYRTKILCTDIIRPILPDLLLPSIALLLSAVMTWANVGFGDGFMPRWGLSFVTSLVVLPMILVCLGVLESMVDRGLARLHWVARKVVVSLLTACAIETVLAFAVTAIHHPLDSTFTHAWWIAFSRSLPVGIVIGVFMCFYMKPKMDRMRKAAKAGPR